MKKGKLRKLLFFSILLIICMSFLGCEINDASNNMEDTNNSLVYVQKSLSDKLDYNYFQRASLNSKNQIFISAYKINSRPRYLVVNEEGIIESEIQQETDGFSYDIFSLDEDDNTYVLKRKTDDQRMLRKISIYDAKGNLIKEGKTVEIINQVDGGVVELPYTDIKVDSEGNIYLLDKEGSIEILDEDGQTMKRIDTHSYSFIEVDEEDNLIVGRSLERLIECINPQSEEIVWSKFYDIEKMPRTLKYNKKNKALYGINSFGVFKYASNGDYINKLFDYKDYSIIDGFNDFVVDYKENVYIFAYTKNKDNKLTGKILKYEKTDSRLIEKNELDKKEIVISLNAAPPYLERAAREFEEKNPNIRIKIKDGEGKGIKEYIEITNTELITGKAADMFFSSLLPYDDYASKGLLVNFDEFIEKDKEFDINNYNKRIVDAVKNENGLYKMPLAYSFDIILANKKILEERGIKIDHKQWIWEDLYNISRKISKEENDNGRRYYAFPKIDSRTFFWSMIEANGDYLIDYKKKEASFNTSEFMDILRLCKEIQNADIYHPNVKLEVPHVSSIVDFPDRENIAFTPTFISSYNEIYDFKRCFGENYELLLMPRGKNNNFISFDSQFIAINNNSKYKEESWEFIKYLISEEFQDDYEGLSEFNINNKVMERNVNIILERDKERKNEGYEEYYINQGDIDKLNSLINSQDYVYFNDNEVIGMIWKEVEIFLGGKGTAEETAKIIQNKVELYLNE